MEGSPAAPGMKSHWLGKRLAAARDDHGVSSRYRPIHTNVFPYGFELVNVV